MPVNHNKDPHSNVSISAISVPCMWVASKSCLTGLETHSTGQKPYLVLKTSQFPMFREDMGIRKSTTITWLVQHNFLLDSKSSLLTPQKPLSTTNRDYHRKPQFDTAQRSTDHVEPRPISTSVSEVLTLWLRAHH